MKQNEVHSLWFNRELLYSTSAVEDVEDERRRCWIKRAKFPSNKYPIAERGRWQFSVLLQKRYGKIMPVFKGLNKKLKIFYKILRGKQNFQQKKIWCAAINQQQVIWYLSTPKTRPIYMTMQLIILVVCKLPACHYIRNSRLWPPLITFFNFFQPFYPLHTCF